LSGIGLSSWFASPARWGRLYRRTFLQVRRSTGVRPRAAPRAGKWFLAAAVLLTLAGAGLRASFLNHPMRYDESWVYFDYATHPLHDLVTRYNRVANHLLHTALEHVAIRFVDASPPVIRLPAFIAGTALIPLAIALGWAVTRRSACGLLAGGLVAASCVLVDYSANARGYTMICAFTLGMCLCTVRLVREPWRRRFWPMWALLALLGAFTVPIMVFPVAGLALLIALDAVMNGRRRRRRVQLVRLTVTLVTLAVAIFLVYLPAVVRTGVPTVLAAAVEVQGHWQKYFGSVPRVVRLTWQDWVRDAAAPALLLGGVGLALGLVRALASRSVVWAMPWGLLAGGVALAALLRANPYPRVWLYLLPVVLTFAACGLALIRPALLRRLAIAALTAAVLAGGYRVAQRELLVAEKPPSLVDAEAVAQMCADLPPREFGLVMLPMTDAVRYYAHRRDLPRPAHPVDPRVRAVYVVVNSFQSLEEVLRVKGETWVHQCGSPVLYKTLPHSRVYRMERIRACARVAGIVKSGANATVD